MTAAPPLRWLRDHAGRAAVLGIGAGAALGGWALLDPSGSPPAGWLIGLAFWVSIALGAVALLAVHALTGGKWGAALRPALGPAAASVPLFAPLALPLLLGLPALYPWATDPGSAVHPDVARLYLNPQGFALRTLLSLLVLSAVALLLLWLRDGGLRSLVGALGLVFHLGAVTLVALDWLLSIDPRFRSTAFGVAALVTQMLAALAWAALLRSEPEGEEPGQAEDLAALLLAAAIGVLYLGFVQWLVAWYGDLPEKAEWFLRREGWGWLALQAASLLLSAGLPFAALLLKRVRRSPAALARLGLCVLGGILGHLGWIVAPAFGPAALLAGALGAVSVGGLWIGFTYGPLAARLGRPREAAHAA